GWAGRGGARAKRGGGGGVGGGGWGGGARGGGPPRPPPGGRAGGYVGWGGAGGRGAPASQLPRPCATRRARSGAPAAEPARGLLNALQRRVVFKLLDNSPLQLHRRQGEHLRETDQHGRWAHVHGLMRDELEAHLSSHASSRAGS